MRLRPRGRPCRVLLGPAGCVPLEGHLEEAVAEGVLTAQGHRPPPDRPVVGRQLAGPVEVDGSQVVVPGAVQVGGETALGAGQTFVSRRWHHRRGRLGEALRELIIDHPVAQFLEVVGRRSLVELDPGVVGELRVGSSHDAVALVHPDDGGDVPHAVGLGEAVLGVDQDGKLGDGLGEGSDGLRVVVEGDRDQREAVGRELGVVGLPDRQVVATPSPGGEGDEQPFAAPDGAERQGAPVEGG